jgi:hypothetical protein
MGQFHQHFMSSFCNENVFELFWQNFATAAAQLHKSYKLRKNFSTNGGETLWLFFVLLLLK